MKWNEQCYSRILIDNHITEERPEFMTRFDPVTYVAMVKRSGVDAAMVYACCHNGNCYYPTRVGHMHANLQGRDIFGETVDLLTQEGVKPVAYHTVIFHNQSAKDNPCWQMEAPTGSRHRGRYWFSCPSNADHVEFSKAQLAEVVAYPIVGIFVDMVFWPMVCLCRNCRERYLRETANEIPTVIDWSDRRWVTFQRARERWMADYVHELTDSIRSARPDISVTFQFSPVLHGWSYGQSPAIAAACDYTSGDFYGGRDQQSLGTRVLAAFSRDVPYEFMTSRCVDLYDHTSMKSEEELFAHVSMTLANAGAYFFIDAINPDGTLEPDVYERLARVSARARPFKDRIQALRPQSAADVGLYFSMQSHVNRLLNGLDLKQAAVESSNMAPLTAIQSLKELSGTSVVLGKQHVPYRIVTSDRPDLDGLNALIVNDVAYMSAEEAAAMRCFVNEGGTLIATGSTSLCGPSGELSGDFQLSDVFGVSYSGSMSGEISYLSYLGERDTPPAIGNVDADRLQHVASDVPSPLVRSTTATAIARVCETYTDPRDPEHYASIHSNPPGPETEYAGLTVNQFGKGKCIYLYAPLFASGNYAQQTFVGRLVERYVHSTVLISADAPGCVEITVLKSEQGESYLMCFVNYQHEPPGVPVTNISATIRLPEGVRPVSCVRISDGRPATVEHLDDGVKVTIPELDLFEIVEIATR